MAKSFRFNCLKCDLIYEVHSGVTDNCCFESYYCNKCEKVLDMSYEYSSATPNEGIQCSDCGNTEMKLVPGSATNKETGEVMNHKCPRCDHDKFLQSAPVIWD